MDPSILQHKEKVWINLISDKPQVRNYPPPTFSKAKDWKIRLKEKDFLMWINSLKRPCLFFDGASKSSGYILECRNASSISFEWGLGIETKNKEDAYGLLLGSEILNKRNYMNPSYYWRFLNINPANGL